MDISSLNLIKTLNSLETKKSLKEINENKTNDFNDYLNKCKSDLKESNSKNTSKKVNEKDKKYDSKEDLKKVLNKIENVLKNKEENIDSEDFLESVAEIIMMLLNNFSSLKNLTEETSKLNLENLSEINTDNITLQDLSKFIAENLVLKEEHLDKNKIISEIDNIKTSVTEILNSLNDDKFKVSAIQTDLSLVSGLEEIDSLNENLMKQINELIKDFLDKDILKTDNRNINEDLVIDDILDYLKNNFIKDDSKLDINVEQIININNLNNVEVSEIYENQNYNDLDSNQKNSNDFIKETKDMELSKEDDFLSKILNDDTSVSQNNYYDRLYNNKILSNTDVVNSPVNVNKNTMNADIIKNIKYMLRGAIEELTVKIYPKELGELTIKILSEEGIMRAEIKATSKETYNLMNSNMHEIKKSLENQSIKIQEVNIGIYNEDTTFFSDKERQNENPKNFTGDLSKSYISEEEEVIDEIIFDNNVNYLA